MGGPRTVRTLGVAGPASWGSSPTSRRTPEDGQVRVDTLFSGLSAGTELTLVKASNPYLHASSDAAAGVFREGAPARRYPVQSMGFMEAARVVESRTPAVAVGDVVALNYGHRAGHVLDPVSSVVTVLPAGLAPLLGIYVAQMGPICASGLLQAATEPGVVAERLGEVGLGDGVRGRRVLVTGGGDVGLLTGLLARVHGAAEVALSDPDPGRLAVAEALGLLPVVDDGAEAVRRVARHSGPRHQHCWPTRPEDRLKPDRTRLGASTGGERRSSTENVRSCCEAVPARCPRTGRRPLQCKGSVSFCS